MSSNFTKKKEDFTCKNCGFFVEGDGYTNHCPKCLYSMHVDVNPGDREESCLGMMKPVDFEKKDGKFFVIQRCVKCNFLRKNKISEKDDFQKLIDLSKQ